MCMTCIFLTGNVVDLELLHGLTRAKAKARAKQDLLQCHSGTIGTMRAPLWILTPPLILTPLWIMTQALVQILIHGTEMTIGGRFGGRIGDSTRIRDFVAEPEVPEEHRTRRTCTSSQLTCAGPGT